MTTPNPNAADHADDAMLTATDNTPHSAPSKAPGHYTAQHLARAAAISQWLREHDQSRSWLARKVSLSSGTISQVLTGKYPSPPGDILTGLEAVLQLEAERLGDGTPGYVEGSMHKLAWVVCDRTRKHANFGVLVGNVGVGKTRTLKEYRLRKPQTLMVEANPQMQPGSMLAELLEQLGATVPAGLEPKFLAVVKALKGTNHLVIIDEAESVSAHALHYLRRMRDKAEVGVVLAGTTKLHTLLKPEVGQFDQIRSRVSMWPKTVERITRDDMDDMARAGLRDASGAAMEVPDSVLDALWAYCDGSARVLMESLLPALRDYGLGKALTAQLVDKIAGTVLFMSRRSGTAK